MERNSAAAISPIRSWVNSFLRHGYGVIPIGSGAWLKSQAFRDVGHLAIPTSLWVPIGKLYVIPVGGQRMYLDSLRRVVFAKGVLRFALSVAVLVLLVQDLEIIDTKEQKYYLSLLAISFVIGAVVPIFISGIKLKQWVKAHGVRIRPAGRTLKKIRSFNVLFSALALLYGAFQGLLISAIEARGGKTGAGIFEQTKDAVEDSAKEYLRHRGTPLAALTRAVRKMIVGMVLLVCVTWGLMYLFDKIISKVYISQANRLYGGLPEQYDPKTVVTTAVWIGMGLLFMCGLIWSIRYLRISMRDVGSK